MASRRFDALETSGISRVYYPLTIEFNGAANPTVTGGFTGITCVRQVAGIYAINFSETFNSMEFHTSHMFFNNGVVLFVCDVDDGPYFPSSGQNYVLLRTYDATTPGAMVNVDPPVGYKASVQFVFKNTSI